VDHLHSLPVGSEMMTSALADAIQCPVLNLPPNLEAPLKHGLIFRRQRDDHPRSPYWWSATDNTALPKVARTMVEVPAGADESDTHRRDSQHVLKAEAARPDATDREIPAATASPVGGPTGAGQPAAAGPAGAQLRIALWSDGTLQIERAAGLVLFTKAEARQIVGYLDSIALDAVREGATA